MVRSRWCFAKGFGGFVALSLVASNVWAQPQPADRDTPEEAPTTSPAPAAPLPPEASDVAARLEDALAPKQGGLKASEVAQRAETTRPGGPRQAASCGRRRREGRPSRDHVHSAVQTVGSLRAPFAHRCDQPRAREAHSSVQRSNLASPFRSCVPLASPTPASAMRLRQAWS